MIEHPDLKKPVALQPLLLELDRTPTERDVLSPSSYAGFATFHKYWGKKPVDALAFLVQALTSENDIVLDPFVGSGGIGPVCTGLSRRFIGVDVNPVAVELSKLALMLPSSQCVRQTFDHVRRLAETPIHESYLTAQGNIVGHLLWNQTELKEVWVPVNGRRKQVFEPSEHDLRLSDSFSEYRLRHGRPLHLELNPRINATPDLTLRHLFSGRALRNIDILFDAIETLPENLRIPLLLSVTAAAGQMSQMVFAITGRGKTTGATTGRTEVGSWVIGYWRPPLHFEINVWNCFARRVAVLEKACDIRPRKIALGSKPIHVLRGNNPAAVLCEDNALVLSQLEEGSISLIITDPPHADRIPYLELSEMWNALLNLKPKFQQEIVISNAKSRHKNRSGFIRDMRLQMAHYARILKPGGFLAMLYNSSDGSDWEFLKASSTADLDLHLCGSLPANYSATSVVQDNRKGGMKSDHIIVFRKAPLAPCSGLERLQALPTWKGDFPSV